MIWRRLSASSHSAPETNFFSEQENLLQGLSFRDAAFRAELRALSRESDPNLFYEGLLGLGARLESSGRWEEAVPLYSAAMQSLSTGAQGVEDLTLQRRFQVRLDAILGRGAFGDRAEFLLRHFAQEATRPDMLLGMTVAGWVASSVRLGVLSRLAASSRMGWWSRSLGASMTASTAAFVPEIGAFWASSRLWQSFSSSEAPPWDLASVGREWASLALTLGLLKLCAAASRSLFDRVHGIDSMVGTAARGSSLTRFSRPAFEQFGMWAGIATGHWAETRLGLRPSQNDATFWADSLATLLQFNVGARLSHLSLGEAHAQRMAEMAVNVRRLEASLRTPRSAGVPWPTSGMVFAEAGISQGPFTAIEPERVQSPHLMMSVIESDGAAGGAPAPKGRRSQTLWAEWLRLPRASDLPARREIPYEGEGDLFPALDRAVMDLQEGKKILQARVPSRAKPEWYEQARLFLEAHPELAELRLGDFEGEGVWASRYLFALDGKVSVYSLRDPILQSRPAPQAKTLEILLRPAWHDTRESDIGFRLKKSRVLSRLSLEEVAGRLQSDPDLLPELRPYRIPRLEIRHLRGYERGFRIPVPFPILRRLAQYYRADPRAFIVASNRNLYPDLDPRYWSTENHPLYLEGKADLRRIEAFQTMESEGRDFRDSLGWRVFSARKDPVHYLSSGTLAEAVGIGEGALANIEMQSSVPTLAVVERIAKTLDLNPVELTQALNRSFYPELHFDRLFPGQGFTVEPRSLDRKKIEAYLSSPGSLGQMVFTARKRLPGSPSVEAWSQAVGRDPSYLHERELNRLKIQASNLPDWVWLFGQLEIPLDILRALAVEQARIPASSPVFLLAEAQVGRSQRDVAEEAGVSPRTLVSVSRREHVPQPETILSLQQSLSDLDGARLFVLGRPSIAEFFPEAKGREPFLYLSEAQVYRAMHLHLGAELFAFRHDPPLDTPLSLGRRGAIDMSSVAQHVGLSKQTISAYESIFMRIQNDAALAKFADLLALDRRELFLHYNPEILDLFPLRVPESAAGELPASNMGSRAFLKQAIRVYDRYNMRRKLSGDIGRLDPVLDREGSVDPTATLAAFLDVPESQARKYLAENRILNSSDIQLLAGRLPGVNYRDWYEHFHFSELAFFLGRGEDGRIQFPSGEFWNLIDAEGHQVKDRVLQAAGQRGLASQELRLLNALLRKGEQSSLSAPEIFQLASISGLDRSLLFLYYRRNELRPVFASGQPE